MLWPIFLNAVIIQEMLQNNSQLTLIVNSPLRMFFDRSSPFLNESKKPGNNKVSYQTKIKTPPPPTKYKIMFFVACCKVPMAIKNKIAYILKARIPTPTIPQKN